MKTYYKAEATEKVINDGKVESGDTIKWFENVSYSKVLSTANKWIKDKNVNSVWIYRFDQDEYGNWGDPTWFMYKYQDSKKWQRVSSN